MKTKKLVSLVLGAAMLTSVFAGCGTTATKDSASKDSAKIDNSKEVTLKWFVVGNQQPADMAAVQDEANKITKKAINAKVEMQVYDWGSYKQKVENMLAAHQEFDICFTASWSVPYKEEASKSAFVQITDDKLNSLAPDAKAKLGDDFIKGASINGKLYGLPCNKEKAHQWGILFRTDLLSKYNLTDAAKNVKTLADLEPLLKTVKEKETAVYPLEAVDSENPAKLLDWDTISDDNIPGVVKNDDNSKVFDQFATTENKDLYTTMHKYFQNGYIRKDSATVTDYNADESAGKIFAMIKSCKPGKDAEMTNSTKHPWTQVNITNPIMSNRDTTGSMLAISTSSKNQDRALQFLNLLYKDKDLVNLYVYGIKDKHYSVQSDGKIKLTDAGTKSYNYAQGWIVGDQFSDLLLDNEDGQKWSKFQDFNKQSKATKTLGFSFDSSKVKSEVAAVTNVYKKYVPALETGTADPTTKIDEFEKELKSAGSDTIIKEMQTQLDKWKKTSK